jgi:phosphatidylserine decarboxylase
MRIDRAGAPFIAGALLPAAALAALRTPGWSVPFVGLAAFMAWFFRDPDRFPPREPHLVLAPADGRVVVAGPAEPGVSPPGDWQQVSIFLSPLDVHINRVPFSGELTRLEYKPGRFLPAYNERAAAQNERTELWVTANGRTVVFRQVVGVLARRIVCRARVGDRVTAGDRFGLMKFGSRMDVFVPLACGLEVTAGDRVRAGETIVARFDDKQEAARERAQVESTA